jgi:hypothetical protein
VTTWTLIEARRRAVRVSWALRYLPVPPEGAWWLRGACAGSSGLFTDDGTDRSTTLDAIAQCEACPVRLSCLRAAACEERFELDVHGVRGGFSAAERRAMRRRAVRAA